MYKLLRKILKELKSIRKELHIIASNMEPCNPTYKIHESHVSNEDDIDVLVNKLHSKLLDSIEQ